MQKKTENSRLNLFYILYILKKNTDDEHPISAMEICNMINKEFGYLSVTGKIMSQDTVKRTLDNFIEKIFPISTNMLDYKQKYGFCVCCVSEDGNAYKEYISEDKGISVKKYYYYDSDFTLAEVKTLKDAMETYNYFSEEDITEIITKLMRIRPKSFPNDKYFDVARTNREEDSLLLMNIDILNESSIDFPVYSGLRGSSFVYSIFKSATSGVNASITLCLIFSCPAVVGCGS